MTKTLRGRPALNLELRDILEAVRHHGKALTAARHLGCSDAYIHQRLRAEGLSLKDVLDAPGIEVLLPHQQNTGTLPRS